MPQSRMIGCSGVAPTMRSTGLPELVSNGAGKQSRVGQCGPYQADSIPGQIVDMEENRAIGFPLIRPELLFLLESTSSKPPVNPPYDPRLLRRVKVWYRTRKGRSRAGG